MLVDGQEVDREVGATSSERLQQMFQKAKDVVVAAAACGNRGSVARSASAPGRTEYAAARRSDRSAATDAAARSWQCAVHAQLPVGRPAQPRRNRSHPAVSADFPPSLVAATVRLRVEDAQGRSFGTGTIIDSRSGEALVITCGHLFRESKGKGPVTVELFEAGPNGVRVVGQVPGQVISYDLERDVALVSIRPNRPVSVAPVAPPRTPIERGDRVGDDRLQQRPGSDAPAEAHHDARSLPGPAEHRSQRRAGRRPQRRRIVQPARAN